MKRFWKTAGLTVCAVIMMLMLSSCVPLAEDLYVLPRVAAPNAEVENKIDKIRSTDSGFQADFISPISGEYRQSSMSIDLDGGEREQSNGDEIIYFLRNEREEKPLQVVIIWKTKHENETSYDHAILSGKGEAIESFSATDLDGDGVKELIIGWRESASRNLMEIYSVEKTSYLSQSNIYSQQSGTYFDFSFNLLENGSTYYTNYSLCGLSFDQDQEAKEDSGRQNIFLIRRRDIGNGVLSEKEREAVLFCLTEVPAEEDLTESVEENTEPTKAKELEKKKIISATEAVPLSKKVESVQKITIATLSTGAKAVYVDSEAPYNEYFTDVFAMQENRLVSIVKALEENFKAADSRSLYALRTAKVFCTDIEGNRLIDVPVFQRIEDKNEYYRQEYVIKWYTYSAKNRSLSCITYYNPDDIWYYLLRIDENSIDKLCVRRVDEEGLPVIFSYKTESSDTDFLKISTFRGDDKEEKARELLASGKCVRLGPEPDMAKTIDAVYVGEVLSDDFPEITRDMEKKFRLNPEWVSETTQNHG